MDRMEVAVLLDRLGTAYRTEVPEQALDVWADHLGGVAVDVAIDAVENIIGIETYFPTVARFQHEVAEVHRIRARERMSMPPAEGGPSRDCGICSGTKWYEVEPVQVVNQRTGEVTHDTQWKPCQRCAPVEHERWVRHQGERVKRQKVKPPSEHYVSDISSLLADARRALNPEDAR